MICKRCHRQHSEYEHSCRFTVGDRVRLRNMERTMRDNFDAGTVVTITSIQYSTAIEGATKLVSTETDDGRALNFLYDFDGRVERI